MVSKEQENYETYTQKDGVEKCCLEWFHGKDKLKLASSGPTTLRKHLPQDLENICHKTWSVNCHRTKVDLSMRSSTNGGIVTSFGGTRIGFLS
ncbi:Hypothetical predicted protein [Marmota monax]|uniref:Uncharacterized protein n=1 Tax=Marmota monax TaxID=9995 RepID=A0A5E4CD19_MARMO|nr:Hypothetical predicted protein [Marmota monax]